MAALALGDEHRPRGDLQIGQLQREHLTAAQPANTLASAIARSR